MQATGESGTTSGENDYPSAVVGWWTATVFFILYTLSFIDRQLLNLLVEPVKAHLGVSDFEVSLLQGFTFALFYTVFGLGIGWLVDNRARRPVVFAGITLWSLAAAACGLASRYWQLALARAGVAVGEASLAPAAYSIMSDTFPPRKLALPMSVMGAGAPLGGAAAMLIGGYILAKVPEAGVALPVVGLLHGWQIAFLVVGLPGLLLAPLIFTVPDRRRANLTKDRKSSEVFSFIRAHPRFYFGHFMGFGLYSMINYGITAWFPTFLVRRHDLTVSMAGYYSGLLAFVVSIPGALAMGWIVDRWFASGRKDAHLQFYAGCVVLQVCSVFAAVWVDNVMLALVLIIPQMMVAGFTGVAGAALQIATPARIRGQVSAIYLLVFNLLGLGLGPSMVAVFSDFVFQDESRVGSSLVAVYAIFAPMALACMLYGAPAMRRRVTEMAH